MADPTRRQIMQMADEVGITDYEAAARLVRLTLAAFRPAPVPVPVAEGEVGELVAWLRERATWCAVDNPSRRELRNLADELEGRP